MQCPNPHCVLRRYGIIFFCPLILQQLLGREASASLLAALTSAPFGLSAGFVWLNARHSRLAGGFLHAAPTAGQTESSPTKASSIINASGIRFQCVDSPEHAPDDGSAGLVSQFPVPDLLPPAPLEHTDTSHRSGSASTAQSDKKLSADAHAAKNRTPHAAQARGTSMWPDSCSSSTKQPPADGSALLTNTTCMVSKYSIHAAQARGVSMWPSPWRRRR